MSAYDRAVAWAIARGLKNGLVEYGGQRQWLAQRDACRANRDSRYRDWIAGLDSLQDLGPRFVRTGKVDNGGDDLMLGSLQSPTGSVAPLGDDGFLSVRSLGEDWFLFMASATHFYDPHDGRGANASFGDAVGLVRLTDGVGIWIAEPSEVDSCALQLTRISANRWRLVEGGGGGCSGIGATLTGTYLRQ